MAIDTPVPRSRRALLAASLGGLAAFAAAALGRPAPARTATGDYMTLGTGNSADAFTGLTTTDVTAFWATSGSADALTAVSDTGHGAWIQSNGNNAVFAWSASSADALTAVSDTGHGAWIQSNGNNAVFAWSASSADASVVAKSFANSTGLLGYSNAGVSGVPAAPNYTGVYGQADQDYGKGVSGKSLGNHGIGVRGEATAASAGTTYGVWGKSSSSIGVGVRGEAAAAGAATTGVEGYSPGGKGVYGTSGSGHGVFGYSTSGTGGSFSGGAGGIALRASGRVQFDGSAGLATIPNGQGSVQVTPGFDITTASKVLATMQTRAGGTTTIHRVVRDTANDRFTIYLTTDATQQCRVAWFVIS